MFAGIILFLKEEGDILQGINKLDYLLKVSIYQIYKNKQKQESKVESMRSSARNWTMKDENGMSVQSQDIFVRY